LPMIGPLIGRPQDQLDTPGPEDVVGDRKIVRSDWSWLY